MRSSSTHGPLTVRAISGTYVVLLGIDVDRAAMAGSHGFGIERLDHTEGEHRWLPNNLRFAAVAESPDPAIAKQWGTDYNPLQTYLWGDYTAKPDHVYTYVVHSMGGEPGERMVPRQTVSVRVRTEQPENQGVWFNRGVISSQAYAQRFSNKHPRDVANGEAWRWLSRGLLEAFQDFVGHAVDERWDVHGSLYEFRHAGAIEAFAVAKRAGARIHLVVEEGAANEAAAEAAGLTEHITWRRNAVIPHNKFVVLSRDGMPIAVWTGSTNLTENGIYGQSNVGHSHASRGLADQYLEYWAQLKGDPKYSVLNDWVDAQNPLPEHWPVGTTAVFSPRTRATALDRYVELFAGAGELVCGTFPFTLDSRFAALLPGEHPALRYLLFEDPKRAKAAIEQVDDTKTVIVAGNFVPEGPLEGWAGELKNPLSHNVEYIHTKFLLIDPLSDDPVVVTGSANFSENSSTRNDENMLVIRGETAVADIYFTEFMRLFEHYKFRFFLALAPRAATPGALTREDAAVHLDTTDEWWPKYYDEPARVRQREVFAGTA